MIAEFKALELTGEKDAEGKEIRELATFRLDTTALHWSIVGSVRDAEGNYAELKGGDVVPQPRGVWNLSGREKSQGLMTVAFLFIPEGEVLTVYLSANVKVSDFNLPVPVESVRAIVAPGNEIQTPQEKVAEVVAKVERETGAKIQVVQE